MLQGFNTGNAWGNFINAQGAGHKMLAKGLESLGGAYADKVAYDEKLRLQGVKDAKAALLQQVQGNYLNAKSQGDDQTANAILQNNPGIMDFAINEIKLNALEEPMKGKYTTFRTDTGTSIIDSTTGQVVRTIENPKPETNPIDTKLIRDLYSDVNKSLVSTKGITVSAKSLENLKQSSSAAAQLAAVTKFMKSLDPTSIVSEREGDMARSTGGAVDYFISFFNKLKGGGSLTGPVFTDLVNTAKNMAKTAQVSSYQDVTNYLSLYGDTIDEKLRNKILKLTPQNYIDYQIQFGNPDPSENNQNVIIQLPSGKTVSAKRVNK